jgi:hypothetical protein
VIHAPRWAEWAEWQWEPVKAACCCLDSALW